MNNSNELKNKWIKILDILSNQFNDGQPIDLENIIYLIGVQELGQTNNKFNKDQKLDLMHIAICRLLEPFGFYQFEYIDNEGWPHYKVINKLPNLKSGEQSLLMKEAVINYFIEKELIQ
ncbi:MAG: hypothetical protein ACKVJS_01910 [Flavobacteriales bacterium]|jgi:hypothetical protein|tara:strand:- start:3617 stop:3973 length:357 start_codon:yes stop_codon:yes gene_type:complete